MTQSATISLPGEESKEEKRETEEKATAGYGNGPTVSRGIREVRDCFGRAPISTALWAPGGICGRSVHIAAQRTPALLPRRSRPRRH